MKKKNERVFANNFARFYEKKLRLGTSDVVDKWFVPSAQQTPNILATSVFLTKVSTALRIQLSKYSSIFQSMKCL